MARPKLSTQKVALKPTEIIQQPKELELAKSLVEKVNKSIEQKKRIFEMRRISEQEDTSKATTIVSAHLVWSRENTKKLNDKKLSITEEHRRIVTDVNKVFKTVTDELDKIQAHAEHLLKDYDSECIRERMVQVERAAKAAERRGEAQFAEDIRESVMHEKPLKDNELVVSKEVWEPRIINLRELMLAYVEGRTKQLPKFDDALIALFEKHLKPVAKAIKSTDLGIPGVEGIRSTEFARRRGV